jgi:hypothetical protein
MSQGRRARQPRGRIPTPTLLLWTPMAELVLRAPDCPLPSPSGWTARVLVFSCCLSLGGVSCSTASAQDRDPPTLRLLGIRPGGARTTATESWGTFDFSLENRTDRDRQARLLVYYDGQSHVQYGRDVWIPAHTTLSSWMLVGPPPAPEPERHPEKAKEASFARDFQTRLFDRTDGKDDPILAPGEERVRARGVPYRPREVSTTVMVDEYVPPENVPGQLPRPEGPDDEARHLARTVRLVRHLSDYVGVVYPGSLPPAAEGFDGTDLFLLATGQLGRDPSGVRALRHWLQQGGKLWVMLDRVPTEALAPLLGDALDFEVVDRTGLTDFRIDQPSTGRRGTGPGVPQQHDRPVEFARVLLPAGERLRGAVNGWPAWFTRQVGRGKVLCTTLGPRAWFRPRKRGDPPSPYQNFPTIPMPGELLEQVAGELFPEETPMRMEAFREPLAEEVGYAVPGRGTMGLVFGGFLLAALALGAVLRRSRRPEWAGWLGPIAAVGAAGVFLVLGGLSRRAAPATLAVAQVVDVVPGTEEAAVRGMLAMYHPDSGRVQAGAARGGFFKLDMAGTEGQTRRLVLTDQGAWHWEDLALPAGLRFAPLACSVATGEPVAAVARFGPKGLKGRVAAGPFRDLADALLHPPSGRNLAVRLEPDGNFSMSSQDVLPGGQFLSGAVLTDRQQRRQELYREYLHRTGPPRPGGRTVLLAWSAPVDMHFTMGPEARTVGMALLVLPLRLERTPSGSPVTVPGAFLPCTRILDDGPSQPTMQHSDAADMHLRFQLPAEVLPLEVERARLTARIEAPGRRVTVAGLDAGRPVALAQVDSPLDRLNVEIAEARLLRLDAEGGLHLNLTLSDILNKPAAEKKPQDNPGKWTIEYLELEVSGRTRGE